MEDKRDSEQLYLLPDLIVDGSSYFRTLQQSQRGRYLPCYDTQVGHINRQVT